MYINQKYFLEAKKIRAFDKAFVTDLLIVTSLLRVTITNSVPTKAKFRQARN